VDGKVFVTEVLPESQAEVDEVVLAGDVLDEISGCSLSNAYSGQVGGRVPPISPPCLPPSSPLLAPSLQAGDVLRWHDGGVYEPLLPYLKVLKEKEPHFQLQHGPRHGVEGDSRRLQGGQVRPATWGAPGLGVPASAEPHAHTVSSPHSGPGTKAAPMAWGGGGVLRASSPAESGRRMRGVLVLMPPSSFLSRLLYSLRYLGQMGIGKVRRWGRAVLGGELSLLGWFFFHVPVGYSLPPALFQCGGKEVLDPAIPAVLERHSAARVSEGLRAPGKGLVGKLKGSTLSAQGYFFLLAPGLFGLDEYLTSPHPGGVFFC